jgi:hypothetical protein
VTKRTKWREVKNGELCVVKFSDERYEVEGSAKWGIMCNEVQ